MIINYFGSDDLKKKQKTGYRIVLYGAGISGRIVCKLLKTCGVIPDLFADNSIEKIGKEICNGVLCFKPQDIENKDRCLVFVCIQWEKKDILYKKACEDGFENFCHISGIIDEILTMKRHLISDVLEVLETEDVSNLIITRDINALEKKSHTCTSYKGKIAVYTAVFGEYDPVYEPKYISENIDYYYISDVRPKDLYSYNWIDASEYISENIVGPIKRNRWFKMHPHIVFPEYEASIYFDGWAEITKDVSAYLHSNKTGISVFRYYNRDCLYYEALQMANYKRVIKDELLRQINRYLDEGFPLHYGMAEMPVIARFHNNPLCIKIMEEWWNEFNQTALRDQLSFMYVMWKNGLGLADLSLLGEDYRKAEEYIFHQRINDTKYIANPDFKYY